MDNVEQSPRGPSKGIFDTASLLAPSSAIFSSRPPTPVQSPIPHLTHSPSAFSVLGRNAVLVPPPSSNSDSSPSSGTGKICSPIMHHSASDALSSLASSSGCRAIFMHERHQKKFKGEGRKSQRCEELVTMAGAGPCGWWTAGSPIATNPDFVGCGVVPLPDPYGRASMCGRSSVSPAHLSMPQPRRNEFVEEVLGHLYAKPPSAETKIDMQASGIPSPQQAICKTNAHATNLIGVSPKKSSKGKYSDKEVTHGKSIENSAPLINSIPNLLSGAPVISGNQLMKPTSKPSADSVNEQIARLFSTSDKSLSKPHKKQSKSSKPDAAKNGKKSKNDKKQPKKTKEKKLKRSSSESESHIDSSGSSTGNESSGAVSSSSSESSDEEEREKQQKELARLKKQQQELRRKVQELKQASHENIHQKPEPHVKKVTASPKNSIPPSGSQNHMPKPVPSPAHSASSIAAPPSPKLISPKAKANLCSIMAEEEQNSGIPLDLCMKKQEPTFEVSSSSVSSSFASSSVIKKKPFPLVSSLPGAKPTAPKRRGRKPRAAPLGGSVANNQPNKVRQMKKHTIKDIASLMPPKILDGLSIHATNSTAMKSMNNNPSILAKASPLLHNNVMDFLPPTKKNFTLDSLLGETNGTIDSFMHFSEHDLGMLPSSSFSSKNSKSRDRQRSNNRTKKEEKCKEPDPQANMESSSSSDSDPDNEDSSSEDSEHSPSGSLVDSASGSAKRRHKHSYEEDGEDARSKRRRVLPDERECQIPLEHGWRRETRIRCFSRSGVRGDVAYYAPCGKKLRSYPEVVRYLIKNGITDISRDNFTFSTKIIVGEFLECTSSGSGQDYMLLTEQEVAARVEEAKGRRGRLGVKHRKSSMQRCADEEEQQRQWEQKQLQHHLEQQELSRRSQESKMLRQAQRERALMAAREEKRSKAEETRKQKEQQRLIKQQEKFERMEQLRVEREIRAQQLLEEQEMKRQQAVFIREQEMQKRREMLLMVDLERERRRQHMILVRALENRKKQEERERKREEILYEKRINREKKMEQRRMELDYLRELKKPVEDMMLKDTLPVPTLNRIPGVKLAGKAFANALMVFEFLHNFGETLGFDMESLPSLNTLQMALLSLDEKCEEELLSVLHHLLVCAIEDPGVPHNAESATILGQSLKDVDINNSNVSEVLRLYFVAQDKWGNILEWLQAKPFLALNPSQKAEIIAYLCDDLLTSRLLTRQIDSNIENVNVLRKDKWLVEGDLRRYRSIQQRRALKAKLSAMEESRMEDPNNSGVVPSDVSELCDSKVSQSGLHDSDLKDEKDKLDDMENELANESGNESDDTQAPGQISDGEDEFLHLSNEEVCKKIEKLSKQLTGCSNKLTKAFYTIRGATFGMDRYHRRYWVLPKSGGVFVESMESSLKTPEREFVLASFKDQTDKNEEDLNLEDEPKEIEPSKDVLNVKTEKSDDLKEPSIEDIISKDSDLLEQDSTDKSKSEVKMEVEDLTAAENIPDGEVKQQSDVKNELEIKCGKKDDCDEAMGDESSKNPSALEDDKIDCENKEKEESNSIITPEKLHNVDVKECIEIRDDDDKNETDPNKNDSAKKDLSPEKENSIFKDLFLNPTEGEEKDTLPKAVQNEAKSSTKKDTEIKDILRTKSSCESKSFSTIKKEPDIKFKSEDKREAKIKDYDSKMHYKMGDVKDEKKVNIFMPNLCDSNVLDIGAPKMHGSAERQHTPSPSIPPDQNWLLHSPLFASILAGNMLFNGPMMPPRDINGTYFNLPKNDSNNPFGPFLQPGMLSAEQIFKSIGDKPNSQKPWFSILPRMPCDESLICSPQMGRASAMHSPGNLPSPNHSRTPSHSNPVSAPPGHHVASALSNLQMELLNGVPPGFFLHPFMPHQFAPTYQSPPPATCSSHQSTFTPTLSHASPMLDFNLNFGCPPKSSTPNSIPTPSATPGPTSHGCATPTSRDSPSPCFAKRLMIEKMTQEYEAPQPIAPELQKGWWRITDSGQLKVLLSAFHHRGVREKMIQKQLQKHFTFACTSCTQGQSAVSGTDLEITELDRHISSLVGGAPEEGDPEYWSRDIALRVDMAILEQVENLEEKVDGASMQVKGWKPPPKLSVEPLSTFVPACEQYLHWNGSDFIDAFKGKSPKKSKKSQCRKKKTTEPKKKDSELELGEEAEKGEAMAESSELGEATVAVVEEAIVEEPEKNNSEEPKKDPELLPLPPGKMNPVEEAKKRLLKVEAAIEKRYLRPPLGSRSALSNNSGGSSSQVSSESTDEDFVPVGLMKWRNAAQTSRTSSQLAMCIQFLESCTAWDKSIMRASCQFCHSGDNEEKLLLCDGCDKGYHTYCFKPVMEAIPDGDWYCYECLNKATGDNVCVICGTKGKLVECETCPKTFHLTCLEPPLAKMPKGKWYCSGCNLTRPKKSKKSTSTKEKESPKEPKESTSNKKSESGQSSKSKSSEKKEKKEKIQNIGNKDLAPCSTVISEMEKHDDAWPFLTPVNTKQFPTYRKVIKKPIDLATMHSRLDSGQYKCREDFAADMRLIFDNCETFNEDDSPVGQAGHSMRAYFETRWAELNTT